jgi:hypothetical protein
MPLFIDMHSIDGGVSASDVAAAHEADLAAQATYGVNYLRYWLDEEAGKIFCLVEAPDAEAANTVHREAHGLVADEIYPVSEHPRRKTHDVAGTADRSSRDRVAGWVDGRPGLGYDVVAALEEPDGP